LKQATTVTVIITNNNSLDVITYTDEKSEIKKPKIIRIPSLLITFYQLHRSHNAEWDGEWERGIQKCKLVSQKLAGNVCHSS